MELLWVKTFHLFFVMAWFAGLFYLPRFFVHHAMVTDQQTDLRLQIMERKLFRFTTPIAFLAILTGLWLWSMGYSGGWLHAKITLVGILLAYHFYCGCLIKRFAKQQNQRSHRWYRVFNEIPAFILLAILALVIMKPF